MKSLRILGSSVLLVLAACASTASGTVQEINERIDLIADTKFEWSPIGVPAVDGPLAGFVAYNVARQQVLLNNRDSLEYGVLKQVEVRAKMIAEERAKTVAEENGTDLQAPDGAAMNAAVAEALAELTAEERAAYDREASAMQAFTKTMAQELVKAGVAAVAAEAMKELLADPSTLGSAKALGVMQGMKAASQLNSASDMVDAAAELDALIKYIDNGMRFDESITNN